MTRIFNIIMLMLLGGIFYVQSDGFGSQTEAAQTAEVKVETPIQTAALIAVEQPSQENDNVALEQTAPPSNVLTPVEIAVIHDRFVAQRLAASTLIRTVKITKEPTAAPKILLVSGNVVNARARPTTASAVLAKLRRGTKVIPTGESKGGWAQVVVSETGIEVWMHSKFLTEQS